MTTDTPSAPPDEPSPSLDIQGKSQRTGVPAAGRHEPHSYNPIANAGVQRWQANCITRPGLDERGNVFFALIEMTRMPMVVTDPNAPDNPIVFANRSLLDLLQLPEEQVLGRNCRFLQGEKTDPRAAEELRQAVAEQRPLAVEILNYKADGTPFWNALFIGPLFDTEGKLLYWFASLLDVSSRRTTEQSMRQAQKMEAIGQLTAGMAHDFNNLLHVIVGNLEVAKHLAGGHAPLTAALARAEKAAFKGGKLTQQLLTFARKQKLEPRQVSLNGLVIEFSEMMVQALGDPIELRLDLQPGLPGCLLDPVHLEMALLNVLLNARDAMPSGGRVTIGTVLKKADPQAPADSAAARPHVVLSVRDEGTGMPQEVLQRAAEPFFTTKSLGTGLGLAMVHGFVEQSRGRVEIDSQPGRGTTIRMIFPVAAERPEAPAQQPVEGGSSEDAPARVRGGSPPLVLLVEDSDDVRALAQAGLASLGCRVLSAANGEAALALLEQHGTIDLLVTDLVMPGGMSGLELADRVKEKVCEARVLLMTGYMEELFKTEQAAAYPVLTKPFRTAELARQVRNVLAQPSSHDPQGQVRPGG